MGISDKDYGDALIKQHAYIAEQMKGQATVTGTITLTPAGQEVGRITQPYGQFKALTEQDLRHEGMKAPLSALVDMWTVRWGSEWVGETEFQEDDFWRIALVRLTSANKLEKYNLANQYMSVYRIIE